MAILKITSSNLNLSQVLQKNPASGLYLKSLRNGMLFGYFPQYNGELRTNEYVVHFKDASDSISYKRHPDEQFEHLNASKYNDARFINDAIQEVLHSAREGKGSSTAFDLAAEHSVYINLCETEFKTIDIFQRYFEDVTIEYSEVSKDNYRLTFTAKGKLSYLLKVVNLFGIFATLNSPTFNYLTEDLIAKYIRIANDVDAPYFIKYLIKIRMCRSESKFLSMKGELEKSSRNKIEMQFGDSHNMRINFIKNIVDDSLPIVDIGTGIDFRYLKIFAPKLQAKGLTYYAIERDPDALARIRAAIKNRCLEDTVEIFESLEEFLAYHKDYHAKQRFNVICTEVLEHNTFIEATQLVKTVCSQVESEKFVITVPNIEFNQFYGLGTAFRHDDHKWEATFDDLVKLVPGYREFETYNVGDTVDGIPVTYGLLIKGK
jgi:hypothetical protein